jgi:ribosomal protein S18 acetylase RimI-like enzyme
MTLYIYKEDDIILGAIAVLPENDPPYKTITGWIKSKSLVLHRILVHPNIREKGIAQKLLDYTIVLAKNGEYESLKIDTHRENYKMMKFLEKNDFKDIGYLEIINREAYEKVLEVK